jgi:hypothetical protein
LTGTILQGSNARKENFMAIAIGTADSLTAHAVCAAAGVRDGFRTAQFYVRDMSNADGLSGEQAHQVTSLSKVVAVSARLVDWILNKAADLSVRLLVPHWRDLPSPFAPGMSNEVVSAIRQNRLVLTSLFTAYFFRAARHILEQSTETPNLILEHRVDAARRLMAAEDMPLDKTDAADLLGKALLYLVEADAVARVGRVKPKFKLLESHDPNIAVMATACLALLLAEDGKPIESVNEDQFFLIAGALLAPRLDELTRAIKARDVAALANELRALHALY